MQRLSEIGTFPADAWTKSVPKRCLVDRDAAIIETCQGKRVLHVGACDAPFDIEKGIAGLLLHQKVREVATEVVGVDIYADAIAALRTIGIDDILEADICSDIKVDGVPFDVVLRCDVIEHVPAPGLLLAGCCRHMRADSKLVVTTINATALKPALRALRSKESVHTDHVAYYSYATLGKLLVMGKLEPIEFAVVAYPTVNPLAGWVSRQIMAAAPATADGMLMTARISA